MSASTSQAEISTFEQRAPVVCDLQDIEDLSEKRSFFRHTRWGIGAYFRAVEILIHVVGAPATSGRTTHLGWAMCETLVPTEEEFVEDGPTWVL